MGSYRGELWHAVAYLIADALVPSSLRAICRVKERRYYGSILQPRIVIDPRDTQLKLKGTVRFLAGSVHWHTVGVDSDGNKKPGNVYDDDFF